MSDERLRQALVECVTSLREFKRLVCEKRHPEWWMPEDEEALQLGSEALASPRRERLVSP